MQDVERFRKRAIFQHWWIVACSLLLGITGLFMFLSWVSPGAWGGYAGVVHRIGAVGFVAMPVLYFLINPRSSLEWLKETFTWGVDDLGWLQAAPTYYFGGPEEAMPPQGRSNTGQKLWMLVVVVTGVIFVVTGGFMWFAPSGNIAWAVILHDVAFIVGGAMLLVHIALAAFHPRMSEALRSMTTGKASVKYAKSHHGKWYEEITSGKKA
jgi:formate dehydrogenase subunit gamma